MSIGSKIVSVLALVATFPTGALMIVAGLGLAELPADMRAAPGGDKFTWGAQLLGISEAQLMLLCGGCKVAAAAAFCSGILARPAAVLLLVYFAFITYSHVVLSDAIAPMPVLGAVALAKLYYLSTDSAVAKRAKKV